MVLNCSRIRLIGCLLLAVLVSMVALMPFGQGTTAEAATTAPRYAAALRVAVRTTSDWTSVTMSGIGRTLISQNKIVAGQAAPGLKVAANSPSSVSLRKSDTTPVEIRVEAMLIDPTDQLVLTTARGKAGRTEVVLYKWIAGQFQFFGRYINEGTTSEPNRTTVRFTINATNLWATRIPIDWEGLPDDVSKSVWALYYPWWGSPFGPSREWSHWGAPVTEGQAGISAHFPIYGAYDCRDESLVEAQILQAKYARIDGFIASWNGPSDTWNDTTFSVLLNVAERLNFKVGMYYESLGDPPLVDPAVIAGELIYFIQKYSDSPALLKIDGRPVIFIYAPALNGRTPALWAKVRTLVEAKVGRVFLVGDVSSTDYVAAFDGFQKYLVTDPAYGQQLYARYSQQMDMSTDTTDLATALNAAQTKGRLTLREKLTLGTATPGIDDWKGHYLDRMSGETYEQQWQLLQQYNLKGAVITSWNEWGEGTEIEPSAEYGFQYLTATRWFASRFKGVTASDSTSMPSLKCTLRTTTNPARLQVTFRNAGSGDAIAVRVETKMGVLNTKVVSSSPYPHRSTNVVNYIPLLRPGESATVSIAFSGTTLDSKVISTLMFRCFSVNGKRTTTRVNAISLSNTGVIVPPAVVTSAATGISGTGATLNGNLASLGTATSVKVSFQWGTTTAYGNATTALVRTATGSVSVSLKGLTPGTTYHYRVKAVGNGTVYGLDRTFTA